MTANDYKQWFIEEFKDASTEQIKTIGTAIFGVMLGYLQSDKKQLIADFKKDYGIGEDTYADRQISRYVMNYIQYDEKHAPVKTIVDEQGNEKNVKLKKPTLEEAVERIKKIRR